jgi:hypothetical protein
MEREITHEEILEAINVFASNIENRFSVVDQRFEGIETHFNRIESTMATMVTKDYLDEKLSDLRGDLVVLTRKEDTKVKTLIDILFAKGIISQEDKKQILAMEPFAQV